MKAMIFVRTSTPKVGLVEYGHVGWGFEISKGIFNVGAVENAKGGAINVPPSEKDQWCIITKNPHLPFGVGPSNPTTGKRYLSYDLFKVLDLPYANVDLANQMTRQIANENYDLFGNNCMDAVYRILTAYGARLAKPVLEQWPMKWWENIQAQPLLLKDPIAKIDFSLYEHPGFGGDSFRFTSNNDYQEWPSIHIKDREIEDCASSINLRSGTIQVFEHPRFGGDSQVFHGPLIIDTLRTSGMEDKISSIKAWAR